MMANFLDNLPEGFNPGPLDLSRPLDNQVALLKMQADLSGTQRLGGFGGYAWGWIPGEANPLLFGTYGIGCSRLKFHQEENGWRFYHREVLYYTDPRTNEVLRTWNNPMTGQEVEVVHILNDPVHRFYPLSGGRFAPPYPYKLHGDDLVFQMDVFRAQENPITRKDYPLHSQQDVYQSAELWSICGRFSEVNDPEATTASCHTSWARISMWLPFMEMGNRPGHMVYHSHTFTMQSPSEIPKPILEYTEKNHPQYLEAPTEWQGGLQENSWTISKKIIDQRREAGKVHGQSVFGIFK